MKAVIPAAGQGTRLYPQTHTKPKPMVRVAGKPILGHILDGFQKTSIEEVVVVVGVMREHVEEYVAENYAEEFNVTFVEQSQTEGLGHCIYQARNAVGADSMCIALGDMLFESGYGEFLAEHESLEDIDGTIGVKQVEYPSNYGVVTVENGRITGLVEKPENPRSNLAISGIYILEDSVSLFEALKFLIENDIRGAGDEYQLTDALEHMVDNGSQLGVFEVEDWYDCGRPETLLQANRTLLEQSNADGESIETGVVIPPVDIGENVTIERSVVGPHVSIDDNVTITDSRVRDGIVGRKAALTDVNLSETIVGEKSSVKGSPTHLNVGDSSEVEL